HLVSTRPLEGLPYPRTALPRRARAGQLCQQDPRPLFTPRSEVTSGREVRPGVRNGGATAGGLARGRCNTVRALVDGRSTALALGVRRSRVSVQRSPRRASAHSEAGQIGT